MISREENIDYFEKINKMERRNNNWNHVFEKVTREEGIYCGGVDRNLTFFQSAGGKKAYGH